MTLRRTENRAEKLWIPSDSPYIDNKAWIDNEYPKSRRVQLALFEADNVLTPEALLHVSS